MKKTIDISLLIFFHHEGLIAIPSLKSALQAKAFAKEYNITVEIIVLLDCPSQDTKLVIKKYENKINKIQEVTCANPGTARSLGIKMTKGRYVALLDGDDLISKNWLFEAYLLAKKHNQVIIHPEVNLYFGSSPFIFRHQPQHELKTKFFLFEGNPWTSLSFAKRSIYIKFPYRASAYGHEDWQWNCDTLGHGIDHIIAKNTVHFIRQKRIGSEMLGTRFRLFVTMQSVLSHVKPFFQNKKEMKILKTHQIKSVKNHLLALVSDKVKDVQTYDGLLSKIQVKKSQVFLGPDFPGIGLGEMIAKIMSLLPKKPHHLILSDLITQADIQQYQDQTKPTLFIVESSSIKKTSYKKQGNLLIIKFSKNNKPISFLEKLIIFFIIQYQPKYIVNIGSVTLDAIFEKYDVLIPNKCQLLLKVMGRHLNSDTWPFEGYARYHDRLNKIVFESSLIQNVFNNYYTGSI